ncbi:MAG: NUDIX domain-containing protein [Actinomycetota bacterium]
MGFKGSTVWRIRQKLGSDLLLWPSSNVIIERADGKVLLGLRGDTGGWAIPGGGAEEGSSFADTAVAEVAEEVGLTVDQADLVAFASSSSPVDHLITYPGGDRTHYFGMLFLARAWTGEPSADGAELTEIGWFDRSDLPSPLFHATEIALDLYARYLETGAFQAE